jgi:hypothetical protein
MKTHEKNRTDLFSCPYEFCTKSYTTKSNLKVHIRVKHEGKTFKCQVCGYELTTKQRYKQHLNMHLSGEFQGLSNLTGVEVAVENDDFSLPVIAPPLKIEVPTESEVSD